jgi:uncharacterized ferritin-like protein (DUF455 family)
VFHMLRGRLAVINLVHEARGLDTFAASLQRLERAGDPQSAHILSTNFQEEVGAVPWVGASLAYQKRKGILLGR